MADDPLEKLARFADLTQEDQERIRACTWRVEHVAAGIELNEEGAEREFVNVALNGWAYRYKQLQDGRRQIVALLLPGDLCDPCVFLLDDTSHSLATLTPATVVRLKQQTMMTLLEASPMIARAFWLDTMVSAEVQREWTVNLGRRTAIERMAHLFCELIVRLRAAGLGDASGCEMPLTQADLGDVLGLSAVHVNRTLQELRAMRLINLRSKRLNVLDEAALQSLAQFSPDYLHLRRRNSRMPVVAVQRPTLRRGPTGLAEA